MSAMAFPKVRFAWFETTDDVVWTGHDGKPRCAHHPYICLVRVSAVPSLPRSDPDDFVCAECLRAFLGLRDGRTG